MNHKEQIISAIEKEIKICQRLYTKLPEGGLKYKPQEGMRDTLELLQTITAWGSSTAETYVCTDPDEKDKIYEKYFGNIEAIKPEDFHKLMNEQLETIKTLLKDVSDDDLLTKPVTVPWGEEMKLGQALLETTLKWLTGYKMQLFLYAKMAGATVLDTGDCWIIPWED